MMASYQSKITKEELSEVPKKHFEGDITVIDSEEKLQEAISELAKCKLLGFDTETKPAFKKGTSNTVSLLQLSNGEKSFLFQLKKIGLPNRLKEILANPNIIKAGVAIRDDIKALNKLNSFTPNGFVELQTFVRNYGIEDMSLAKLSAIVLGFRISKSQRLSNWESDSLSEAQQRYAATDAWVGYKIYSKLITS